MEQELNDKRWGTVQIPAKVFQERLNEIASQNDGTNDPDKKASVYSRLALIHQVARAYAFDQVRSDEIPNPIIDIDELTDPPLSADYTDDEIVIITFSYTG